MSFMVSIWTEFLFDTCDDAPVEFLDDSYIFYVFTWLWILSSQENIQSGWYVAEGGEDEGRAGFSKVTQLTNVEVPPFL